MIKYLSFFFRLLSKINRLSNVSAAKKAGLKVGERSLLVGHQSFGSEPFLIEIGEDCLVTDGVRFVTHDGAIQVPLLSSYGYAIDQVYSVKSTFDRIKIGNNVFIGVGSIILPGTSICDNSIVAAGSVVKGTFPVGVVLGGNPAKILCSVEEYYEKNERRILTFKANAPRREQILNHLG